MVKDLILRKAVLIPPEAANCYANGLFTLETGPASLFHSALAAVQPFLISLHYELKLPIRSLRASVRRAR